MRWMVWNTLLLGSLCVFPFSLFGQQAMDLKSLKGDTLVFQRILDERLKQGFSDPFAVTGQPQAAYLQGYGIVVSYHLNINRYVVRTPFGEVEAQKGGTFARMNREHQLETVKDISLGCLADYSPAIKQLGAHDRISVSAHVEDRNELDPAKRTTVVIVTALKDDVDLLAMRKISDEDFRKRVTVVEY
jgi:hypothetical protein